MMAHVSASGSVAPIIARSLTVPRREPADVAAREERRVHDVRIGREDEPAIPDPDRGAVVHRGEADAVHGRLAGSVSKPWRKVSVR
jgi:hypothetical protein